MKKILSLAIIFFTTTFLLYAQLDNKLFLVLNSYYDIKNALVQTDAVKAGSSAAEFIKAVNGVEINKLTADEQKVFQLLQPKIVSDSKLINGTKDINRQREAFASLSNSMISLAKNARLSNKEVYLDYCPMKKSYWLSAEQSVKNPYYGSTMLTCGTVKETIKQ